MIFLCGSYWSETYKNFSPGFSAPVRKTYVMLQLELIQGRGGNKCIYKYVQCNNTRKDCLNDSRFPENRFSTE